MLALMAPRSIAWQLVVETQFGTAKLSFSQVHSPLLVTEWAKHMNSFVINDEDFRLRGTLSRLLRDLRPAQPRVSRWPRIVDE